MAGKKVNSTDGFQLHGWMVTELHLSGAELVTFALVHQFSQSDAGVYTGNTSYLASWTGWTTRSCRTHLLSLVNKGLIVEVRGRKNNSPFVDYKLAPDFYKKHPEIISMSPCNNFKVTMKKTAVAPCKNFIVDNNIDNNIDNNTPPTPSEVEAYCRARGWADPAGFADYYIAWQNNAGWKTKTGKRIENWKQNVLVWERNHKTETFAKQPQKKLRQMTDAEYLESLKK